MSEYTVPGMSTTDSETAVSVLSARLTSLIDLSLTLKHIHWNVIGKDFIAVHKMLDPQVDAVRGMTDETAERIATLGGVPLGTPGAIVGNRTWADYALARAEVHDHLRALNDVYTGVITDHRKAQATLAETDAVSEDLVIGQLRELELFQWFVRAHLENASGKIQR